MSTVTVSVLLSSIDQAYNRKSWHGATLRGALGRVSFAAAAWRPAAGRPSIWEIVVHCAYWKYRVARQISEEPLDPFPYAGSDWFARDADDATESGWRADLDLLGSIHRALRERVAALSDQDLSRVPGRSETVENLVRGIAFHDVHHGGQVQLLKRLYAEVSGS